MVPHLQREHAAPQATAPPPHQVHPPDRRAVRVHAHLLKAPNEDPCSLVKRSDNPPASKVTLTTGLCLTGEQHTRAHMANPSLLPKGTLPLHSEPRTDVTNYLLVLSSKVRPTRVEIRVLSVSTTDRVSPLGGRDHEATWWEKRRGLHRKPSKGWHLIGFSLGRAPLITAGWKLGVGLTHAS